MPVGQLPSCATTFRMEEIPAGARQPLQPDPAGNGDGAKGPHRRRLALPAHRSRPAGLEVACSVARLSLWITQLVAVGFDNCTGRAKLALAITMQRHHLEGGVHATRIVVAIIDAETA